MELVVLTPGVGGRSIPPSELSIDPTDARYLTWIDLDRGEAPQLASLALGLPHDLVRRLVDPAPRPSLDRRESAVVLALFGVSETAGQRELTDLDVVDAPGLLLTVHSRDCPALGRLGKEQPWRNVSRQSLSATGLGILIGALVDAYDGLVADAETEVDLLVQRRAGLAEGRAKPSDFLAVRRRMVNLHHLLRGQREVMAELPGSVASPDDSVLRALPERLESVIEAAGVAAEYAMGSAWSWGVIRRRRDLAFALAGAWLSLAAAIALVSLANVRATGDAFNPIGFLWAATTLFIVTAAALTVAWVQRWR